MASGLTLLHSAAADIPTPAAGKVTIFFNTATGLPSYKDDAGSVSPLGTEGSAGPAGDPGPPGADANTYFPGGWG
jgi:hypothetical protein